MKTKGSFMIARQQEGPSKPKLRDAGEVCLFRLSRIFLTLMAGQGRGKKKVGE